MKNYENKNNSENATNPSTTVRARKAHRFFAHFVTSLFFLREHPRAPFERQPSPPPAGQAIAAPRRWPPATARASPASAIQHGRGGENNVVYKTITEARGQ